MMMLNKQMVDKAWNEGFLFSKALFEGDLDVNDPTNYPSYAGFTDEDVVELNRAWLRGYEDFREAVL